MVQRLLLVALVSAAGIAEPLLPTARGQSIAVQSWCTHCGRTLPWTAPSVPVCPYCGSGWIAQRTVVIDSDDVPAYGPAVREVVPGEMRPAVFDGGDVPPAGGGVVLEKVIHKPKPADLERAEKLAAAGRFFKQRIINGTETESAFTRMPSVTLTEDEVALLKRVAPTEELRPLGAAPK